MLMGAGEAIQSVRVLSRHPPIDWQPTAPELNTPLLAEKVWQWPSWFQEDPLTPAEMATNETGVSIREQIASRTAVSQLASQTAAHPSSGTDNTDRLFRPVSLVRLRRF
jgi:hypothetical protein